MDHRNFRGYEGIAYYNGGFKSQDRGTLKILRDKQTSSKIKVIKQREGRVISNEERKARLERVKKYWDDKKKKN